MRILLKNARLVDPEQGKTKVGQIFFENGIISSFESQAAERVIECNGKYLAPGLVDIGVKICEPGERHKESFKSAGQAAAAGGVTTIITRPDTLPAIDTPETLEFTRRRANLDAPINVLPKSIKLKEASIL